MKIVFVVTSFWAYGELLIAKKFADKLIERHEVMFLVPPSHKATVSENFQCMTLIPRARRINRIIINEISEKYNPDLVILSDFLNYAFADKHYGLLREDLDLFKCKIATFDNFDWKKKRRCMDTYGFVSDIPRKVNIDDYGARIIPCPLGEPSISRKGEYRFSLVDDVEVIGLDDKQKKKEEYITQGIIDNRPVILTSYAKWQENYAKSEKIDRFIEVSNRLFDKLMMELSKEFTVICVGGNRNTFINVPGLISVESVPPKVFDEYVEIADLYIGRNITSTSMISIAMSGTPCINIINSFGRIENKDEISCILGEDVTDIRNEYRYMMYPVGWYEFLKPLFDNNPYGEIIENCELFDFYNTIQKCECMLRDSEAKKIHNKKVISLRKKLKQLREPYEIVEDIVYGVR